MSKWLIGLFVLLFPLGAFACPDVDGDNVVSVTDVHVVLKAALGLEFCLVCDVNGDERVTVSDAVLVLLNLGCEVPEPIEGKSCHYYKLDPKPAEVDFGMPEPSPPLYLGGGWYVYSSGIWWGEFGVAYTYVVLQGPSGALIFSDSLDVYNPEQTLYFDDRELDIEILVLFVQGDMYLSRQGALLFENPVGHLTVCFQAF